MEAVKNRKLLLANILKPKPTKINNPLYPNKNNLNFTNKISLCNYRQSLIKILDELEIIGLNPSKVKLIAGDDKCCYWVGDLNICDCFNEKPLSCDGSVQNFLQQSFERGNYMLLIMGTENDLERACQIINSCHISVNIWYL